MTVMCLQWAFHPTVIPSALPWYQLYGVIDRIVWLKDERLKGMKVGASNRNEIMDVKLIGRKMSIRVLHRN